MVKIIREILVLPLRLLLLVNKYLSVVDKHTLAKWIWKVSRTAEDGYELVMITVEKFGLQAGRDLARKILEETKSAWIAYAIAWQEMTEKNYQEVKSWIDYAEEISCKEMYHTLIIKFYCAWYIDEYDREKIIDEMLACNYLQMGHTKDALIGKMDCLMREEKFEDAEKIIDHMLSIQDGPAERLMKGTLCLRQNDDRNAEKHFSRSKGNFSDERYYAIVGRTYLSCDRIQKGFEWLYKAVGAGYKVPKEDEQLWEVIHSKEFADYCAMQN